MRIKHPIALGLLGFVLLLIMGVLTFAAGGIVGRHQVTPLVVLVDTAEAGVKTLLKSVRNEPANQAVLTTAYYHLRLARHSTATENKGDHVALASLTDGYLLAQRAGGLKFVDFAGGGKLQVEPLSLRVPTNKAQFLEDGPHLNAYLRVQFGVKDLLVEQHDDELRLYATHHVWKREEQCTVLRLSMLQIPANSLRGEVSAQWQTVVDTAPCLGLTNKTNKDNEDAAFLQAGGRLAFNNQHQLLMTVGDHFRDSVHNENLVQDPSASYGKVLMIDVKNRSARVLSTGHRNPQGLYVDGDGNVWATEHGPRGGDELNLLEDGGNYGWPYVNYGTDYKGVEWPEHLNWAGHEGYTEPVYAWLPSIAVNNLIRLEGSGFPLWEGNLMVASLKDKAIHRLTLDGRRVVINERIPIDDRVRDLTQTDDGKLLLLTDNGVLVTLERLSGEEGTASDELQAARLWVSCDSCHSLEKGERHRVGPNLHGIIGSEIARFDDYSYSDALTGLDGRWTRERLDEFLRDPQKFAPGTAMVFSGLPDAEDRQRLLDYLESH